MGHQIQRGNIRGLQCSHPPPSTCRDTGRIFSRYRHSTTVSCGGPYRHRYRLRHDPIDQGIWKIPRPTYPNTHSYNRAGSAIPYPTKSGADSSAFWSALYISRTIDCPDHEDRPNGKNDAPEDVGDPSTNAVGKPQHRRNETNQISTFP